MIRVHARTMDGPGRKVSAAIRNLDHNVRYKFGVYGEKAEAKAEGSNITVGQKAAMHELGLGGQKRRSFVGDWLQQNEKNINRSIKYHYKKHGFKNRLLFRKALLKSAHGYAKKMQQNIIEGNIRPPLAQSTIDAKGHSTPLLDTTQLVNAIDYDVLVKRNLLVRGGTNVKKR